MCCCYLGIRSDDDGVDNIINDRVGGGVYVSTLCVQERVLEVVSLTLSQSILIKSHVYLVHSLDTVCEGLKRTATD